MEKLRSFAKRIPDWGELSIVLTICFSIPILSSVYSMFAESGFGKVEFTDARLLRSVGAEIILGSICTLFLWLRGYKIWQKLVFKVTLVDSGLAILLYVASDIALIIIFLILIAALGQQNLHAAEFSISAHLPSIILISIVNPLFEEVFVMGYVFDKLSNPNVWLIIFASAMLRTSYHLYQGWFGIVSILPMGLIFAFAYSRRNNLWAFYIAHAAMDLIGLMQK